jgi:hypothetical protein
LVIARSEVTKQSHFREIAADFVLATFGIAAPREARLAMTLFLFSDPDARSRNPEALFFFTQTPRHFFSLRHFFLVPTP